jgi:hypothetical protein
MDFFSREEIKNRIFCFTACIKSGHIRTGRPCLIIAVNSVTVRTIFRYFEMAYSYLAVDEAMPGSRSAVDIKREMYCRQKSRLRRMILTGKDEITARPAGFRNC